MVERSESTKRSYRQLSWSVQKKAWEDKSQFFSCQLRKQYSKLSVLKLLTYRHLCLFRPANITPCCDALERDQRGGVYSNRTARKMYHLQNANYSSRWSKTNKAPQDAATHIVLRTVGVPPSGGGDQDWKHIYDNFSFDSTSSFQSLFRDVKFAKYVRLLDPPEYWLFRMYFMRDIFD